MLLSLMLQGETKLNICGAICLVGESCWCNCKEKGNNKASIIVKEISVIKKDLMLCSGTVGRYFLRSAQKMTHL